jgi:hypothetical protein
MWAQIYYNFSINFCLNLLGSRRAITLAVSANADCKTTIQQLLGDNIDPDSEPEGDGDHGSTTREIRVLWKEVNELREKFGELKGRVESLPEVMGRDLKNFTDKLTRDLSYSLRQIFTEIDQKIVQMVADIKALIVEVVLLVQNIQI